MRHPDLHPVRTGLLLRYRIYRLGGIIAVAKALLVAAFFMHLRGGPLLLRLVAATALLTLTLLFGLSATDYAARVIRHAPWQTPPLPVTDGSRE